MHQTKTGILLANLGTPDAPTPRCGEALSATIPQRQTGGGYISSAMVAAAAWRHTADSLPRAWRSSISPCGWRRDRR